MGEHEAYHLGPLNRILHWICIPFEHWGIVKILSLVELTRVAGVFLILVFYYHLVEILLALGYRPELKGRILRFRDLHLSQSR